MGCGGEDHSDHDGHDHDHDHGDHTESITVAANETINLGIEGMVCSVGCAKAIEEKVGDMSGIASCIVHFEEGKAEISFDNKSIAASEIISTIAEMNDGQYKVKELGADQPEEVEIEEEDDDVAQATTQLVPSFTVPQVATYLVNIF